MGLTVPTEPCVGWENPANDGSAPMLVQQHRITMPPAAAFKPSTDLLVRVESEYNAGTAAERPTKGAGRPGNDELPSWIAAPSVDPRGYLQTPSAPPRPLDESVDLRGCLQTPSAPLRPPDEPTADLRGYLQTKSAPPRERDNGTPPVPRESTQEPLIAMAVGLSSASSVGASRVGRLPKNPIAMAAGLLATSSVGASRVDLQGDAEVKNTGLLGRPGEYNKPKQQ